MYPREIINRTWKASLFFVLKWRLLVTSEGFNVTSCQKWNDWGEWRQRDGNYFLFWKVHLFKNIITFQQEHDSLELRAFLSFHAYLWKIGISTQRAQLMIIFYFTRRLSSFKKTTVGVMTNFSLYHCHFTIIYLQG